MTPRLPPDTSSDGDDWGLKCPWCSAYAEEATVTLDGLLNAFTHNQLHRPDRDATGRPDASALTSECRECRRPFMVALRLEYGFPRMRLLACRTEADLRLLEGRG